MITTASNYVRCKASTRSALSDIQSDRVIVQSPLSPVTRPNREAGLCGDEGRSAKANDVFRAFESCSDDSSARGTVRLQKQRFPFIVTSETDKLAQNENSGLKGAEWTEPLFISGRTAGQQTRAVKAQVFKLK
ncbi:hypothetical protein SKAU_G00223630 [Synaphobranchus kaupii]|uniref:Uncharacterized protein n=1 Tax=Synaphobranchus kaupii TaxID=118154 RepID=A0A9Q1IW42_SYNKA|nr:hypothetical protein SKAU_G00223630 [Synaphobranchus kaupii]